MNSIAIVESPVGQDRLYYMASVLSNVLRKNSAQDHRDLARAVQGMLLADHPPKPLAAGELAPSLRYGQNFIGYQEERKELQLRVDTQEALLALGYEIGDIVGSQTRKAIRSFEKAQGLQATGKPSPPARAAVEGRARSFGRAP